MKGWRTLIVNGAFVVVTAALTYLAGINWVAEVGDTAAVVIVAAVNIGLRMLTTGPVGAK